MIPVTRWFIKASVLYLAAGMLLLFLEALPIPDMRVSVRPVYLHMLVMGWLTQVVFGVSLWMFPRTRVQRKKGDSNAVWVVFILLNTGLIIRFLTEPFLYLSAGGWIVYAVLISVLMQLIAVLIYVALIWPRLQPKPIRRPGR
jgi:membrane-bound acyltransferase YfiQ involved in biofilm formation